MIKGRIYKEEIVIRQARGVKRAVSLWLSMTMLSGMLPFSAFAAGDNSSSTNSMPVETRAYEETAKVSVAYDSVDRKTATVNYQKNGEEADPFNLIFLVDVSGHGVSSHEAFERMMYDRGAGYIYDYEASSSVQVITYQSTAQSSGVLGTKTDLMRHFGQHVNPGQGNGNVEAGLDAAIKAVQQIKQNDTYKDNNTVVFWVLGDQLGVTNNASDSVEQVNEKVDQKLKELTNSFGDKDALITWQLAEAPDTILAENATSYTPAHETQQITAAYAAAEDQKMIEGMADSLEQIVHDHYHNIEFTLELNDAQKVATKITKVDFVRSSTAVVDVTGQIAEDGKSVKVHVNSMCRQVPLNMTVTLGLDTQVFERETVFNELVITDGHQEGGSGGGLHMGIFDQEIATDLKMTLPQAEVSRVQYTISFLDRDTGANVGDPLKYMPGQRVVLPTSGVTQDGEEFGGWNQMQWDSNDSLVYDNVNYVPGHVFTMPEKDVILSPAYGHVEMYLDLGEITPPTKKGNHLGKSYFSISKTMPDGTQFGTGDIRDIVFENRDVYFVPEDKNWQGNHLGVYGSVPDIKEAVLAKNMSATEDDNVIGYLVPVAGTELYDLHIAGPGGVKAPLDSSRLFDSFRYGAYNLRTIDVGALDVSEVENMSEMFYMMSHMKQLTGLDTWDTSKVTDMSYMFYMCAALTSLDVSGLDTQNVTTMGAMFELCIKLTDLKGLDAFDTAKVTNMAQMFEHCRVLQTLEGYQNWNTGSVTAFNGMFNSNYDLEALDLSKWDVRAATNFYEMFYNCHALKSVNLSGWAPAINAADGEMANLSSLFNDCRSISNIQLDGINFSRVSELNYMFADCWNLSELNLGSLFIPAATTTQHMFYKCTALQSITFPNTTWTSEALKYTNSMFEECGKLQTVDLSRMDTSGVTDMKRMFYKCGVQNPTFGGDWDTSNVTNMSYMFYQSGLADIQLSESLGWKMGMVTDLSYMLASTRLTELTLENLDFTSVTTMQAMMCSGGTLKKVTMRNLSIGTDNPAGTTVSWYYLFGSAPIETLVIDNVDITRVTNMEQLFTWCSNLTQETLEDFLKLDTSHVTDMNNMLLNCDSLTEVDLSGLETDSVINMQEMLGGCDKLTSIKGLEHWDTSKVQNMSGLFGSNYALTNIEGLEKWDVSQVTNMSTMFADCRRLTNLDLSGWTTSALTNMNAAFSDCQSLATLNLSRWDVSKVTNLNKVFYGCTSLNSLDLTGWNPSSATTAESMFFNCKSLTTIDLTGWNTSKLQKATSMFGDCIKLSELKGIENWDTSSLTGMRSMFASTGQESDSLVITFPVNAVNPTMDTMFENSGAVEITVKGQNQNHTITSLRRVFYNCNKLKELKFIDMSFPNLTSLTEVFQGCSNPALHITLGWNNIPTTGIATLTNVFDQVSATATLNIQSNTPDGKLLLALKDEFDKSVSLGRSNIMEVPMDTLPVVQQPVAETAPEAPTNPAVDEPAEDVSVDVVSDEYETAKDETTDLPEEDIPAAATSDEETPADVTVGGESENKIPAEDSEKEQAAEEIRSATVLPANMAEPNLLTMEDYQQMVARAVPDTGKENPAIVVHDTATEPGTVVQYRMWVQYVGDPGAYSGTIRFAFPLPNNVHLYNPETESGNVEGGNLPVTSAGVISAGTPQIIGGHSGPVSGRVVEAPTYDEDTKTVTGAVEGLSANNQIMISVWCVLEEKQTADKVEGEGANQVSYYYWDGVATGASTTSATSNYYRLWWRNPEQTGDDKPDTKDYFTLSYDFEGDVPTDAILPTGGLYEAGKQVTVAAEPTTHQKGYTFEGWYVDSPDGTKVEPGSNYTMSGENVTLVGIWTRDESQTASIQVVYEYTNYGEPGLESHIPEGAPTIGNGSDYVIQSPQTIPVGDRHYISRVEDDAEYHTFSDWTPSLTIGTQKYEMDEENGVWSATVNGKTYTVNLAAGVLFTEQFRDVAGDSVTVTFSGYWTPYEGTIHFDPNGGILGDDPTARMDDLKVAYHTSATLPECEYTMEGANFVGWARTPYGDPEESLQPGKNASGLITEKDGEITLYAVWSLSTFRITYDLEHVSSTSSETKANYGDSYTTTLKPDSGYEMSWVSITMRGVDITSNVYDPETGKVTIPSVTGDVLIQAVAEQQPEIPVPRHTITIEVTGGTAEPNGTVYVDEGEDQRIAFTPDEGYTLKSVTVDGQEAKLDEDSSYTFWNVTEKHRIVVVYEKTSDGGGGGGSGTRYTLYYEENGGSEVPDARYAPNTVVQLTKTSIREGYTFTGWYADEELTERITEIKMTSDKTVYAGWESTDVPGQLNGEEHYAYIIGRSDKIEPEAEITRAEVATIVFRLLKDEVRDENLTESNSFTDVAATDWYNTAISTMASLGVLQGYPDGSFRPNANITRAEFAAICARFDMATYEGDDLFSDIAQHWGRAEINAAATKGWIQGYSDGTFGPERSIKRAEAMTLINRVLKRLPESVDDLQEDMIVWPDNQDESAWYYLAVQEATNSHSYDRKEDGVHESWTALTPNRDWTQYQ